MASLSPAERLHVEVETIARGEEPNMSITSYPPGYERPQPHTATVWFAPTPELNLLTLSAPDRIHSRHIDAWGDLGMTALVSGVFREDGQKRNDPNCHGVAFEGEASRVIDPGEIDEALVVLGGYGTFDPDEIKKYLHHSTTEIPTHAVYRVRTTLWSVFDGRLGSDSPDRLVHLEWPPAED